MTDHIAAFLTWADRDRRRSPATIIRYKTVLASLAPYADPPAATVEQIETWWATRLDRAPATRANELACLRAFYAWMLKFDHRPDDPTRRLTAPPVDNAYPRPIGQADLDRIMGPLTTDALDIRRAFALGVYGGLRVSEVAALSWSNVDLDIRRMFVRGKGRKERAVAISPILLDQLLPACDGNVVTAGGRTYTAASLQRRLNRFLASNGIDHTFHDCRKRGASLALARGASTTAVKAMFGWSSMDTVAHYAAVGDDELDKVAALMV